MKSRFCLLAFVILAGLASVVSFSSQTAWAQEPAADATAPATQEGATDQPAAPSEAPPTTEQPPAEQPPAEEKPAEERPAVQEQLPPASSGGAPAGNASAAPAKVVDSNQQAADSERSVYRNAGMIVGFSLLILLVYFVTKKKSK
jgi:uncharacterized membrane protein